MEHLAPKFQENFQTAGFIPAPFRNYPIIIELQQSVFTAETSQSLNNRVVQFNPEWMSLGREIEGCAILKV